MWSLITSVFIKPRPWSRGSKAIPALHGCGCRPIVLGRIPLSEPLATCTIKTRETINGSACVMWSAMSSVTYARTDRGSTNCPGATMPRRSPLRSSELPRQSQSRSPRECTNLLHSDLDEVPKTHFALDAVEFFARIVSLPTQMQYHSYGRHHHILAFDREAGFLELRDVVNRLFRRCKHPYELQLDYAGRVERLLPAGLDKLVKTRYRTGDSTLDQLLTAAVSKIQDPNPTVRAEALEKLWDAWERLKTILNPDKKRGISKLLQRAFPEPRLRERVDDEANALTRIGNDFMIRHSETTKVAISPEHVDYLFHRLLALVHALIRVL
jgi:hypothetical protein